VAEVSTLAESLEPFRVWTDPRRRNDDEPSLACWVDTQPASDFEIDLVKTAGLAIPDALEQVRDTIHRKLHERFAGGAQR
jgi:hypothetical protein